MDEDDLEDYDDAEREAVEEELIDNARRADAHSSPSGKKDCPNDPVV